MVREILEEMGQEYLLKETIDNEFSIGFKVDDLMFEVEFNEVLNVKKISSLDELPYFETDKQTLIDIHEGDMTALTAMGREHWNDVTPLDIKNMQKIPENLNPFRFVLKFFSKKEPNIIKLNKESSRVIHGSYSIPIAYDKGVRTAWYRVEGDMIINEDEAQQRNPFDTLIIPLKGEGKALLDDVEYDLLTGSAVYIPAKMKHKFWSESEQGFEFIIVMFGEGA